MVGSGTETTWGDLPHEIHVVIIGEVARMSPTPMEDLRNLRGSLCAVHRHACGGGSEAQYAVVGNRLLHCHHLMASQHAQPRGMLPQGHLGHLQWAAGQ